MKSPPEKQPSSLHLKSISNEIQNPEHSESIARAKRQKQIWLNSGFIGCIEGPENLSSNYKKYIAQSIEAKYTNVDYPN